ncbi:MAG: amine dehydrogenase [Gammaproteobacteria bacterium]|nr:amine dehydrogenase [Gammaproteobacteria bacterium]
MRTVLTAWLVFFTGGAGAADLPVDTVGNVLSLPQPYPKHWVWVQDIAFDHMLDGKQILIDPRGESLRDQVKGMFNSSNIAAFAQSATRPEVYVAETYYERGNRGVRSDVITVYDKQTLSPVAEIPLTGNKRASVMPGRHALALTADESLLLIYYFNPATSIGVIDIAKRALVNEVPLPNCALAYPTGRRGFSSLCGNGSLVGFQLDAAGKVAGMRALDPFFDVDQDALFEKPVIIGGIGYFPTFLGNMQEIDLRGDHAVLGAKWNLVPEADRGGGWRPGGALFGSADEAGRLYLLMHPEGKEGSHKDGGPEAWVFDVKKQSRVQRIVLKNWGVSLEATNGPAPLLVVTNTDMDLDIYDAKSGEYLRTIAHFGQESPLLLHAVR